MTELPRRMLSDVLDALRDVMQPREALLTIGRLLAWHSLAKHPGMPEDLAPRTAEEGLTSGDLSAIFRRLSAADTLGPTRSALESDRDGPRDLPYESLSTHALTTISRTASGLVTLDLEKRQALADAWADLWFGESPRGHILVPLEVADLVVRSLGIVRGKPLQCSGYSVDSVAIAAMRTSLKPVIVSPTVPVAAAIYGAITDSEFDFLRRDPLGPDSDSGLSDGIDVCVAVPPWGQRLDALSKLSRRSSRIGVRTSEALGLELVARSSFREAAIIVPNGLLSGRGPEAALRQEIVENGPLAAVISFPSGLLSGTNLPFSVLRLSRDDVRDHVVMCRVDEAAHVSGRGKLRSRDRRFTGTDDVLRMIENPAEPLSRRVPRNEIADQDFVLVPDRYFGRGAPIFSDAWKTVPMGDIVTIVKPQFLKPDESPKGVEIQEAIPSDMPKFGYLTNVTRTRRIESKSFHLRAKQILATNDVLLSTKGTIGTVAIARPDPDHKIPLLPSQASVILRLKQNAPIEDPRFLMMYLRSPAVQQALTALATGAAIQNIALDDLRALPVWVPDIETQARIVAVFDAQADIQAQIETLKAQQAMTGDTLWHETGLAGAANAAEG